MILTRVRSIYPGLVPLNLVSHFVLLICFFSNPHTNHDHQTLYNIHHNDLLLDCRSHPFSELGPRILLSWITINEPAQILQSTYYSFRPVSQYSCQPDFQIRLIRFSFSLTLSFHSLNYTLTPEREPRATGENSLQWNSNCLFLGRILGLMSDCKKTPMKASVCCSTKVFFVLLLLLLLPHCLYIKPCHRF